MRPYAEDFPFVDVGAQLTPEEKTALDKSAASVRELVNVLGV